MEYDEILRERILKADDRVYEPKKDSLQKFVDHVTGPVVGAVEAII